MNKDAPFNPLEGEKPEITFKLNDTTDELVSIVIVHKDRPEFLNIALQTVSVCSTNNNIEIIIVDNNSGKDSQAFLDDVQEQVKVIRNDKNLFWSAACNKGAEAASKNSKYIIFMHQDVAITNFNWIDLMINVCESSNAGMVGIETQSYMIGSQKIDFVQEYLIMFSRECFNDVGKWPEELPVVGASFLLTLKAQQKNWKPQVLKSSVACHYRIFGIDVSEYERHLEQAMSILPKMISENNSRIV